MNHQYMKQLSLNQLVGLSLPHLIEAGKIEKHMSEKKKQWVYDLIALYQEQMSYGAEIVELTEMFFKPDIEYNREALEVLEEEQVPKVLKAFADELKSLEEFSVESIKGATKVVQKAINQKGKKLFMPIRVATTGQTNGPDLLQVIYLLGKEIVLARLERVLIRRQKNNGL